MAGLLTHILKIRQGEEELVNIISGSRKTVATVENFLPRLAGMGACKDFVNRMDGAQFIL